VFKGRKQVGIRIPDDPIATTLASQLGNPLLTTSIELDDIVDDDMAEVATLEIAMKYDNDVALMLDSGSRGVVGSAIVDLTDSDDPQIVRQGPIELR
jgi:tRNA A37 threonylcarbamoyladenosine synthetase subunit TsaC/SUA5/YrdC